jgi:hypothetical protein
MDIGTSKTFLYENFVILARYFLDISNFPLYHRKLALFMKDCPEKENASSTPTYCICHLAEGELPWM